MKSTKFLLPLILLLVLAPAARAEMLDQGLNSIMEIIDRAIAELTQNAPEGAEADKGDKGDKVAEKPDPQALENATSTVVNLSRTLGTLSFSRLQCGEAGVLAEFTSRVQKMPEESRDAMRDAFQEGFDKSKQDSPLLSQDECERLTASRKRREADAEANVKKIEDKKRQAAVDKEAELEVATDAPEDPKFRQLRIAELSGQLAYRRRICVGDKVFNRDYNEYLESIPEEYRDEVKAAYWKGYKHGKILNKNFDRAQCPQT